ncbi:TetR/AcrR family transcriptional regulator [Paenibacillus sp. CAU 1782]
MARQREFNVEKALEAAMEVFWEKGFEAASLSDLTTGMGIQRPSLYAAFGDKKELFEAALRRYNAWHASKIRALLQQGLSVIDSFRHLLQQMGSGTDQESDIERGCFCINTMVEMAPHDYKFAVLTREHQMYLAAIFREEITRGQQSGEIDEELNAEAIANSLVVSVIGLTVMTKANPDPAMMEQCIETALSLLARN